MATRNLGVFDRGTALPNRRCYTEVVRLCEHEISVPRWSMKGWRTGMGHPSFLTRSVAMFPFRYLPPKNIGLGRASEKNLYFSFLSFFKKLLQSPRLAWKWGRETNNLGQIYAPYIPHPMSPLKATTLSSLFF